MQHPVEAQASATANGRIIAWIVLATLLSFVFSGYIPLYRTNIFHLPILLGAYELPQFQSDAFVQSLRNFSSGFWIAFADTSWLVRPKLLLGSWLVISHFAFLGACVHLASSLGYRDPRFLGALAIMLTLASLSMGQAMGGGGLLMSNFSHSELANAAMLMAFSFSLSKRYGYALFFGCVTFFLNAFMAVWSAGPILALAAYHVGSGQVSLRELIVRALPGSVGLILLLPVMSSILNNPEGLAATSFSYSGFLLELFPSHFFVTTVGTAAFLEGVALVVVFALTVGAHDRARAGLLALGLGAAVVLLLGIAAPQIVDSRSILNLHPIRSFVMLHLLAELSLVLFALRRICLAEEHNDRAIGAMTAALLFLPRPLWVAVIPVLLFDRLGGRTWQLPPRYQRHARIAFLLLLAACVAALPVRAYRKFQYTQMMTSQLETWEEVGKWANGNTLPSARFSIFPADEEQGVIGFSYTAAREVWFDERYGAAVMWSPSYYPVWKTRKDAGTAPVGLEGLRTAVRSQDVDYVVTSRCLPQVREIYRYETICVYEKAAVSE